MTLSFVTRLAVPLAAVIVAAGCASKVDLKEQAPVESRTPTPPAAASTQAPTTAAQPASTVAQVDLGAEALAAANRAGRVVYFDFDSFVLKDEFRPLVEAHGKALVANRGNRLTIEGHTDERGGREYNLALGQKRAEAVVRSLVLLGAREDQLEAVSFGEEKPAAAGAGEQAWAQNRRAELKDKR
jgi:peptidoglycan-associated lipoprotein